MPSIRARILYRVHVLIRPATGNFGLGPRKFALQEILYLLDSGTRVLLSLSPGRFTSSKEVRSCFRSCRCLAAG